MASVSTEEGVVNLALARVGSRIIAVLATDTTTEAALARTLYYNVRDKLMRAHAWNFLTKRAELTDSGTDPTFGWDNGFVLPTDFLRVIDVLGTNSQHDRIPYRLEQQNLTTGTAAATPHKILLCNSTTCFLIYIYKETDPQYWPTSFQDAVAAQLSVDLSPSLGGSAAQYDNLTKTAERALLYAKSIDGQEDYPESFPEGSWVTDRYGTDVDRWSE